MKRKVMKMSDSDMSSKLIAVIVEQRNQIVELESQITRLNQAVEAHAISGIGELNQYLMENGIGNLGDMTAKTALHHIKNLQDSFTSLDEANDELLGDYLVAEERVKELEIKLNAKPQLPEPEDEVKTVRCPDCGNIIEIAANNATDDAYLGDFRVLKTAIEIVLYAMKSGCTEYELELCRRTVRSITSFAEDVRTWNGLDSLEPYKWSSVGSGVNHLIDKEWKK
jgi:hypothetical protein